MKVTTVTTMIVIGLAAFTAGCGSPPARSSSEAAPQPTTPSVTTTPLPTASPKRTTRPPARTTAVTVDGWRYGVAWTDWGRGYPRFTKPGMMHATFQVQVTNIDNRRPEAPVQPGFDPDSIEAGFGFYVQRHGSSDCADVPGARGGGAEPVGRWCELESINQCETLSDASQDGGLPYAGSIVWQCVTNQPFPEAYAASDFAVRWTPGWPFEERSVWVARDFGGAR